MKIDEVINNKIEGLYFGNRLILPFKAHFLKVIINNKIITDFSPSSEGILLVEEENFTNLYFLDYKFLKEVVTEYEVIKLLVVEKGEDVFNTDTHKKIIVYLLDNHKIRIEEAGENIVFIV